ncbi:hypothetical protein N7535_006875 [Penicillium sp. DV-2018c]|nr:hypothetical protein N7535_006875 [Penicillium sp. DV-2018c]
MVDKAELTPFERDSLRVNGTLDLPDQDALKKLQRAGTKRVWEGSGRRGPFPHRALVKLAKKAIEDLEINATKER